MKLTETQKNFKKQMEKVKVKYEEDIYDTTRKGNPFYNFKRENSTIKQILGAGFVIFLLFFLPFELYHYSTSQTANSKKPPTTPSSNLQQPQISNESVQTPIVNQSIPMNKSVSQMDHSALSQLESIRSSIGESTAKLSEQHKIPWSKRDINTYKATLTNGIILCNKQSQIIATVAPSQIFIPLVGITNDYINNTSNAYKYYLNYVNNHNQSDLDIANQYLALVNQNSKAYLDTLSKILHDNNYNYSVQNNGVTYSVLK